MLSCLGSRYLQGFCMKILQHKMKSWLAIILIIFTVTHDCEAQAKIAVYGTLMKVMQAGDFSPAVSVDTIDRNTLLFGLGVAADLHGEIIIVHGKCYRSFIVGDSLLTKEETDTKAAMLVSAIVPTFKKTDLEKVSSIDNLEEKIKKIFLDEKLTGALPFLIETNAVIVNYHIIDWQAGTLHSPSNHKQFAKKGILQNSDVTIVGFFSESHQGIFTPHNTAIHMHVFDSQKKIVGHVDAISFTDHFQLQISQ